MIHYFEIVNAEKEDYLRARNLPIEDFEDAVVASLAEKAGFDYIVTRNHSDFSGSPVAAVDPVQLLIAE